MVADYERFAIIRSVRQSTSKGFFFFKKKKTKKYSQQDNTNLRVQTEH